jgi:hypothetical protein
MVGGPKSRWWQVEWRNRECGYIGKRVPYIGSVTLETSATVTLREPSTHALVGLQRVAGNNKHDRP